MIIADVIIRIQERRKATARPLLCSTRSTGSSQPLAKETRFVSAYRPSRDSLFGETKPPYPLLSMRPQFSIIGFDRRTACKRGEVSKPMGGTLETWALFLRSPGGTKAVA